MIKKIFCIRCAKLIKDKDNYVAVIEYFFGEKKRESYYHKICLNKEKKKKEFLIAMFLKPLNKIMAQVENE